MHAHALLRRILAAGLPPAAPCSDVVLGTRLSAVALLIDQVERLMFDLSIWRASPELMVRLREEAGVCVCCGLCLIHVP